MKVLLIIIGILIIAIVILVLIIRSLNKKIKTKENQIAELNLNCKDLENTINQLKGDIEIEKKYNMELAKKLADISCMSIDDVLHELQNNQNS